ncbi:alpha/beta hydrolase [Streptomyces sp. NPDC001793]|uniref:alpha/beta hydrolase n=1 Tax=Streptomyces sp. NPDC001793 TaxID=3154657 RepID=UPI00333413D6
MPGLRGSLAVLAAGALAGALVGAPAPAPAADGPDLTRFYAQRPAWEPCPADFTGAAPAPRGSPPAPSGAAPDGAASRFQCARLEVPRDYAHPERGTVQVQLVRLPATGPGKRLGSLVVNPGGPGDSGVDYLIGNSDGFADLGRRYDLVSFDPRGTGRTEPISCGSGYTPAAGNGTAALAADEKRINEGCGRHSGALLPWVGTPTVARDMDVLRSAVGDRKLAYLGFSYGTRLGSVYAHTFPRNAGRLVLDSVEDPTKNMWQTAVAQAAGFQRVLDDFATDCVHGSQCPIGPNTAAAQRQLADWYQQLTNHPIQSQGIGVDGTTYVYALRQALYSRSSWPDLRDALARLKHGDASGIAQLSGGGSGTGHAGRAAGRAAGSAAAAMPSQDQLALRAVTCRDTSERYGPDDYPRAVRELTRASPLFGPDIAPTLLDCYGWPVPGDDAVRDVPAHDAPPALLVATTGDPATPYEGAANMARVLGNHSVVLTYHGEGHAAYTSGNPCIRQKVAAYLTDGVLPAGGTGCRW